MSVLTLADAKTHLNITVDTYDDELQTVIDSAESAIVRRVGPLEQITVTKRIRGRRSRLTLPTIPAVELTTVTDAAGTSIDVSLLEIDPSGVVEYADCVTAFTAVAYTVVYTAGWGTVTAEVYDGPADLLFAVKELTRHLWTTQRGGDSSTRRPGSQSSATVANTVPGAAYSFPIRVEQLIDPYIPLGI